MTQRRDGEPDDVSVTVPRAAGVYDFALGGHHNFKVDREFWAEAEAMMPDARFVAYANRRFLGRAVRWLIDAGVRQFLDIGSGIPTMGNVHEVAQRADPSAKVMYVDIDPVAVQLSRNLLADNSRADAIVGDLRHPEGILYHRQVMEFLDFSRPVAVLTVAVWHFIADTDRPAAIIASIGDALVRGSYLVMSHAAPDPSQERRPTQEGVRKLYDRTATPLHLRTAAQVAALLDGFEVVEPGITIATAWHPDPDIDEQPQPAALAAVARKL